MMRRFLNFTFLLLAGVSSKVFALEAVVSHAVFYDQKGKPFTELYWQVNTLSLHYLSDSKGNISAKINTIIRVSSDTGIVYENAYPLYTTPFNPAQMDAPTVLDIAKAFLPQGLLHIELTLYEDGHRDKDFHYIDTIRIQAHKAAFYSSLQLLDTSFKSSTYGPFARNGYQQLPRCLNFYDDGQQTLHCYSELYQTSGLPPGTFPLVQKIWISRAKGAIDLPRLEFTDTISGPEKQLYHRHSFSLASLESGNYHLNASLRGHADAELASASTFFQLINKNPVRIADTGKGLDAAGETAGGNILNLGRTFVAKYDMAQLRAILKMMIPTASPSDINTINGFLSRPDEIYIRYFIYNHFAFQNKTDPEKAWKIFSAKVREANKYYSTSGKMGYETDRGSIYLKFGEPAEIVTVPNEAGAQPYEIWRYNAGGEIKTSALFLFYTPPSAMGSMILLHSTVLGQKFNPNWRTDLYTLGQSSGNFNSRAEQYFSGQ